MTHQNHQTNGASLEDCHTNFFALTDLCGIKWRKFVHGERPNASSDPFEDPILRSYSRCMQSDILCVWRRVQSTKQDQPDPNNTISFDICTSKIHPPLSLAASKELWIFWYGEEPDLNGLVDAELLRISANQALWNGTWEKGLSYECRSLLFKALHNLMERFVLTKDIVRFGKWFVQPCTTNDRIFGKSYQHLSFSFTFFVHGDTVCASIDLREHPAVRQLTAEHLAEAAAAASTAASASQTSQSGPTGGLGLDGCAGSGHGAFSGPAVSSPRGGGATTADGIINDGGNGQDVPPRPRKVILAPFGMAATLTGNSYKATDPMAEKILEDFASFFPLCNKENSDLPPVVEVVTGGHKMFHPSTYVLVTDLDEMDEIISSPSSALDIPTGEQLTSSAGLLAMNTTGSSYGACGNSSASNKTIPLAVQSPLVTLSNSTNCGGSVNNGGALMTSVNSSASTCSILENLNTNLETKLPAYYETLSNNFSNTSNTHAPPQSAIEMPERVWQDCITNSFPSLSASNSSIINTSNNTNSTASTATTSTTSTNVNTVDNIKTEVVSCESGNQLSSTDGANAAVAAAASTLNSNSNFSSVLVEAKPFWNFVDPTQNAPCICARCKKMSNHGTGGYRSSSGAACSTSSSSSSIVFGKSFLGNCSGGNTGSSSSNNTASSSSHHNHHRSDKLTRFNRIPFHKRQHTNSSFFSTIATTTASGSSAAFNISGSSSSISTYKSKAKSHIGCDQAGSSSDTIPYQRSSVTNPGTPHGGASTYSRNSIGDSMPVPSVGSPGSAAPSPHPNSTLSQPTSVPPADHIMTVISPRAPTSVSNLQQPPTPIDHLLLDKNTPAPTPTDQHDNKSITASPYVQPTPSVEPPPSAEAVQMSVDPGSVPPPPSVERCTPTMPLQQQQQQQQQCGLISVKKFETNQPAFDQKSFTPIAGMTADGAGGISGSPVLSSAKRCANAALMAEYYKLYKTPQLSTKDMDNLANDDCLSLNTLYDYTFRDAWANHPIKRFKPNEVAKLRRPIRNKNLYDSHTHLKPRMPSPGLAYGSSLQLSIDPSAGGGAAAAGIAGGLATVGGSVVVGGGGLVGIANNIAGLGVGGTESLFQTNEIKKEPDSSSACKDKGLVGDDLYTAEGLNPSLNDLEQLFDISSNDGCGGVQIHTPPDSNKSSNGCAATNTIDDLKRSTAAASAAATAAANITGVAAIAVLQNSTNNNNNNNSSTNNNNNNNDSSANTIQAEDLTKMFPTPPSHEQHHPNSSPCAIDIPMTDLSLMTTDTTSVACVGAVKIKQEYSVELGSPIEEQIEDWSFVFLPPQKAMFVGSSKYAPLTNLPSQMLPPLVIPANCVYKPSCRPHMQQQQQQHQQHHREAVAAAAQQAQHQHHQQQQQHHHHHDMLSAHQPRTQLVGVVGGGMLNASSLNLNSGVGSANINSTTTPMHPHLPMHPAGNMASSGPSGLQNSNLLLNQLNCPQAALTNTSNSAVQQMLRAGMSPISPAPPSVGIPFPSGSPMLNPQRRTPIHPPPPYEMAVSSPATSTSSYLNKQFNSQEPQTPQSAGGGCGIGSGNATSNGPGVTGGYSATITRLPEVSSLMVNILLYDTALNVFRDHNFDSSTLCVCNADSQKCVGNIRGADSGVYVALPGTSFNPMAPPPNVTSNNNNNGCGGGGGSCSSSSNSSMRMLSAFGGLDSPAALGGSAGGGAGSGLNQANQHITGYLDEDSFSCSCGFSAVVNRRLAYRSGLFYEDEMEITGIAEDPAKYKKKSLFSLLNNLTSALGQPALMVGASSSGQQPTDEIVDKKIILTAEHQQLSHLILELLLEQCSIIQTASSSVHRAVARHRRKKTKVTPITTVSNVLEFTDANDIICLALEQARLAFDNRIDTSDNYSHNHYHHLHQQQLQQQQQHHLSHYNLLPHQNNNNSNQNLRLMQKSTPSVHKWPYIPAGYSRNNKDIVRIMNSMQPMLQNAFHTKSRSGQKDATYTVNGPLTWRQFHRLAGRASGQCEPQPIPSVIVGHDKDCISVAPLAIHYWDKLLLEPYSYSRDVVYLIICPENDYVVTKTKTYFKELSSTYEMCKLGRHTPMRGWDGLLTVGPKSNVDNSTTVLDDWLRTLDDTSLAEKVRLYANAFQNLLAPYLNRIPNDKTLLNPPEGSANCSRDRSMHSPMHTSMSNSVPDHTAGPSLMDKLPPSSPLKTAAESNPNANTINSTTTNTTTGGGISTSSDQTTENRDSLNSSTGTTTTTPILGDPLGAADTTNDINPPVIVLYVVEPFTFGSDSSELERFACVALLRCYSELLKSIPDSVRANINIQIISLESIFELGRSRNRKRFSDEIKCLALNIFSQCRRHLSHGQAVKSLTGFGTAANMEIFLKSKDQKNRQSYKMYTPPYILAPMHEKADKTDFSRSRSFEQQYSVMYCNYCMSEDQSWLLATVTDDRGELLEKIIINIDIPNRTRRRKAPARRVGLQKLMDFIMSIISQTVQPWRLVIGRIGRIGHGELKSWSWLLSKQNLQKASKQLKDICKQCTLMYPPSILSACLVTLEPDAKLRVMPDQFTPDERFSQISMQNPLSTPQDVTCTHILVFPTSAVCQSFQRAFNELNETQVDIDNDFMRFDLGDDNEVGDDDVIGDLFNTWDPQVDLERISPHGSPDRLEDNRSWQSSGGNNFNSSRQQDVEEVGSVNQQPLAVGYFVSTAPTGRMPSWFWSSCPHLEDVCPVFLKTALHLHVPNIQNTDDILNANSHSSANDHPLDSTLTADVLRYVLEGYNALSWLALDSNTHDRLSCLPINVQTLMDLYYLTAAVV